MYGQACLISSTVRVGATVGKEDPPIDRIPMAMFHFHAWTKKESHGGASECAVYGMMTCT